MKAVLTVISLIAASIFTACGPQATPTEEKAQAVEQALQGTWKTATPTTWNQENYDVTTKFTGSNVTLTLNYSGMTLAVVEGTFEAQLEGESTYLAFEFAKLTTMAPSMSVSEKGEFTVHGMKVTCLGQGYCAVRASNRVLAQLADQTLKFDLDFGKPNSSDTDFEPFRLKLDKQSAQ